MADLLETVRRALDSAADKILHDYRTWVADDTEAKPRYGQIPEYDAVNAAIGDIESYRLAPAPTVAAQRCGRASLPSDDEVGRVCERLRSPLAISGEHRDQAAALIQSQAAELAAVRAERDAAKRENFNLGYTLAVANLINLHDRPGMAADVMAQTDITLQSIKAMGLTDYDLTPLRKMFREESALEGGNGPSRAARRAHKGGADHA